MSSSSNFYSRGAIDQPIPNNNSLLSLVEQTEKAMSFTYMGNYTQAAFGTLEIKAMSLIYMYKTADALTILNTLVSEGHAVPWLLNDRGVSLLEMKNYARAIANFNATLKAEPMDAYALFNRAEAFLNMDFYSQPYSIQQLERHHHPLT